MQSIADFKGQKLLLAIGAFLVVGVLSAFFLFSDQKKGAEIETAIVDGIANHQMRSIQASNRSEILSPSVLGNLENVRLADKEIDNNELLYYFNDSYEGLVGKDNINDPVLETALGDGTKKKIVMITNSPIRLDNQPTITLSHLKKDGSMVIGTETKSKAEVNKVQGRLKGSSISGFAIGPFSQEEAKTYSTKYFPRGEIIKSNDKFLIAVNLDIDANANAKMVASSNSSGSTSNTNGSTSTQNPSTNGKCILAIDSELNGKIHLSYGSQEPYSMNEKAWIKNKSDFLNNVEQIDGKFYLDNGVSKTFEIISDSQSTTSNFSEEFSCMNSPTTPPIYLYGSIRHPINVVCKSGYSDFYINGCKKPNINISMGLDSYMGYSQGEVEFWSGIEASDGNNTFLPTSSYYDYILSHKHFYVSPGDTATIKAKVIDFDSSELDKLSTSVHTIKMKFTGVNCIDGNEKTFNYQKGQPFTIPELKCKFIKQGKQIESIDISIIVS